MSHFIYKYYEYDAGPFSHVMIYAFRHHKEKEEYSSTEEEYSNKIEEEIFGVILRKCRVCRMSVEYGDKKFINRS